MSRQINQLVARTTMLKCVAVLSSILCTALGFNYMVNKKCIDRPRHLIGDQDVQPKTICITITLVHLETFFLFLFSDTQILLIFAKNLQKHFKQELAEFHNFSSFYMAIFNVDKVETFSSISKVFLYPLYVAEQLSTRNWFT